MNQIKPTVGRIVLFRSPNLHSNGVDEHPAIINRVWTDECVNLIVFPDCSVPTVQTSATYHEAGDGDYGWRWPDRV